MVDFCHSVSLVIFSHVGPEYRVRSSRHLAFGHRLVLCHCLGGHSVALIVQMRPMSGLLDGPDYVFYYSLLSNPGVALSVT